MPRVSAKVKKAAKKEKKVSAAAMAKKATLERKKALVNWSKEVRERDGWKCQICGNPHNLNAHHILAKPSKKAGYKQHELNPMNGICLCAGCHMFKLYSAHGNGIWFSDWLRKNKPEQYEWALENM